MPAVHQFFWDYISIWYNRYGPIIRNYKNLSLRIVVTLAIFKKSEKTCLKKTS